MLKRCALHFKVMIRQGMDVFSLSTAILPDLKVFLNHPQCLYIVKSVRGSCNASFHTTLFASWNHLDRLQACHLPSLRHLSVETYNVPAEPLSQEDLYSLLQHTG